MDLVVVAMAAVTVTAVVEKLDFFESLLKFFLYSAVSFF